MSVGVCVKGVMQNNFSWEAVHLWSKYSVDKQNTSILFPLSLSAVLYSTGETHRDKILRGGKK